MKPILRRLIPSGARQALRDRFPRRSYGRDSYSQEGEDILLARLFEGATSGVYVDVGAHHPFRFSNTFLLHRSGWRGINIDARPGSMTSFRRFRPTDVNLECGVGTESKELEFFLFAEPALNTFDPDLAEQRMSQGWKLLERQPVRCAPLCEILDRELPRLGAANIDLLSVDVEGLDLQVLQSSNWHRYTPRAVVVEVLDRDVAALHESPVARYLDSVGYRMFAKLYQSAVFLRGAALSSNSSHP